MLVNTEVKVGDEGIIASKTVRQNVSSTSRWSGDKLVRDVMLEAVQELTKKDTKVEFKSRDVFTLISKKYPDSNFTIDRVGNQLIMGCPNHTSYHRHSSTHKYYWTVKKGIFRLYDPERDKAEE